MPECSKTQRSKQNFLLSLIRHSNGGREKINMTHKQNIEYGGILHTMEEMQQGQGMGNAEDIAILSTVVRVGLSEKGTGRKSPREVMEWVVWTFGIKCKGPEAEGWLHLRISKETNVTKSGCRESKGSLVVDEDREIMKNQFMQCLKSFWRCLASADEIGSLWGFWVEEWCDLTWHLTGSFWLQGWELTEVGRSRNVVTLQVRDDTDLERG